MPFVKYRLFVHWILCNKTYFLIKLLEFFFFLCSHKYTSYNTLPFLFSDFCCFSVCSFCHCCHWLLFFLYLSSFWIVAFTESSVLTNPLLSSFLFYIQSMLFGVKLWCIVISFLVLRFLCLSASFVHFKNGPKYLSSETSQMFIPLMRFLLQSLVSRSFLVLLRYSFLNFPFIFLCLMVSASNIPKYL